MMDLYLLVPSRVLLDHTPSIRPHIPLGAVVRIVTGEKIPWGWRVRGICSHRKVWTCFSLVHSLGMGKGTILLHVHSQLATTTYSVYSHSRFILWEKQLPWALGTPVQHMQMLLLPCHVFSQHFCGHVYCLQR